MKPAILIVEDEAALVTLLRYNLERAGFEVLDAADGEEALLVLDERPVDLVLLDWMLPRLSGIEVCRQLRRKAETRALPIIILTARGEQADRIRGLNTGADDYVAKPFSPRELVARVRTVLRRAQPRAAAGDAPASPAFVVDEERRRISYCGQALDLTRYEYGLLRTLISRPGRVFSRDDLLARVWGESTDSIDRTVDAHVKTLRAKLKSIAPGLEPIRTHRGAGYALAEDLKPP